MWAGRTVVVHTDTAVTKAILNKGRSKNAFINDVLRAVCWRSVTFDFDLRAIHVPGSLIGILDAISRLHETGQPERPALHPHPLCPVSAVCQALRDTVHQSPKAPAVPV